MTDAPLFPVGATVDEVKAVWRETARRLHPDLGGSAEEFHAAREAYEQALAEAEARPAQAGVCRVCGGRPYFVERGAHRLRCACPACGVLP